MSRREQFNDFLTLLSPRPLSEISVSLTGIYLLGNEINLSEVLSFEVAAGRQVLF